MKFFKYLSKEIIKMFLVAVGYLSFFIVLTLKSTITINKETMKKLLFVFVLGAFAACGGNTGAEATTDETSVTSDTATMSSGSAGTGTTCSDTAGSTGTGSGSTGSGSGSTGSGSTSTPH